MLLPPIFGPDRAEIHLLRKRAVDRVTGVLKLTGRLAEQVNARL